MKRSGPSFTLAICISLTLHAGVLFLVPRYFPPTNPVASREQPDEFSDHGSQLIEEPEPTPLPPVVEEEPKKDEPDEFVMGDQKGTGFALQEADGELEAIAREADTDQAFLSLDPRGAGERGTNQPVAKTDEGKDARPGQPGGGAPQSPVAPAGPRQERVLASTPFGVPTSIELPKKREKPADNGIIALAAGPPAPPIKDIADVAIPVPKGESPKFTPDPETRIQQVALAPPPAPPGPPAPRPGTAAQSKTATAAPAGDPARESDSESDAFSQLGSATFRDGKLSVRFGRKVKTRRPQLLLAGETDLLSMQKAVVKLQIDTDATGKVTRVDVVESSGSNAIDQPTRVAIYEWWFEPKKDSAGNPLPDRFEFVVGWR